MSEEILGFTQSNSNNVSADPIASELMQHQSSMIDKVEQIEAFLNSGGRISQIDPNVMTDPPKKPENRYGSQPI